MMRNRWLRWAIVIICLLIIAVAVYVYGTNFFPKPQQPEKVINQGNVPTLKAGQRLKLMTWNVQFMAGNKNNYFFFENGKDKWPSKKTYEKNLIEVAHVIRQANPDIVLLQEIDQGSKYTHHMYQINKLLKLLPKTYKSRVSTPYWKSKFLIHQDVMGQVDLRLLILSKYKITSAIRYKLRQPSNVPLHKIPFGTKRAVLAAQIPISNGKHFLIMNTHFYAFAKGSKEVAMQVYKVNLLMQQAEIADIPAIIGGDFNLLPPLRLAYTRLAAEPKKLFNKEGSEILPLFKNFQAVPSLKDLAGKSYKLYTTNSNVYDKVKVFDKTVDYFFLTHDIKVDNYHVIRDNTMKISDHLPLVMTVTLPEG